MLSQSVFNKSRSNSNSLCSRVTQCVNISRWNRLCTNDCAKSGSDRWLQRDLAAVATDYVGRTRILAVTDQPAIARGLQWLRPFASLGLQEALLRELLMRCLRVLLVAFCFIGTFQSGAAQLSCSNVPAIPGPIGYQRRLNADRCEGFYQQQVTGTLEFLSLVKGTINYDLVSDKALIVSAPNLSQFGGSQVFLTARALRPGTYYRMDAALASGETFRWPLNAVLAAANLPSSAVGVVAWINRDLV